MISKKEVIINCYEPIVIDNNYQQLWSDIYIKYKAKPGRRTYYKAPTLISKVCLEEDIASCSNNTINMRMLEYLKNVKTLLDWGVSFVVQNSSWVEKNRPHIYTNKEYIDKYEANRLIIEYMKFLGFRNIKLKWKHPEIIFEPKIR